jgi:hypothetical protein
VRLVLRDSEREVFRIKGSRERVRKVWIPDLGLSLLSRAP